VLRPGPTPWLTCCDVVVELRGFEPLTPCMPSRDPHHGGHHAPSRSRPLHQRRMAGAWWFARLRRAELLRACCAKWLGTGVDATPRSLARMGVGGSGFGWAMTVTVALAGDTMLGRGGRPGPGHDAAPGPGRPGGPGRAGRGRPSRAEPRVLHLRAGAALGGSWQAVLLPCPTASGGAAGPARDRLRHPGQQPRLDYGVAAAGRLVLADPLGGGRQPGHGVVSQARTRSKCGASGSSARLRRDIRARVLVLRKITR
jgi:hypothetical protein